MSEKAALVAGTVVAGRYEIVKLLGAGGMGAVYQARQVSMDRMVALKLIHPQLAPNAEVVKRFHREMQATSKIEHPSTIRVFDYGETEGGQLFLAMEFLDGRPLSKEPMPMALPRIVAIGSQVLRALAAAHTEGIAHRDLKPDNVMLLDRYGEKDVVKVLDFGIARFVDDDESRTKMTQEGAVIGTPSYMSPEQAMGHAVDHRTDFYSLGVMLYEMAVGKLPFEGPTLAALLVAHATTPPPPPSTVGPIEPALEALILKLLSKAPDERPPSAAEVLRLLEACAAPSKHHGEAAFASTMGATPPAPRPPKNRWMWIGPIALVVAGTGAFVVRSLRAPPGDPARARLEALFLAEGDPLAPASCKTSDAVLTDRLARAAALLQSGTVGNPRPQDREALHALGNAPAEAAEYFALLSRAKLVVEPSPEGALEAARAAAQKCPDFALAHNLIGNAEQRAKHHNEAKAAYEKALALDGDYLAPRFNLGLLALRNADAPASILIFDEVLKRNPRHPRAHLARGQAHLLVGETAPAIADLQQASLRNPESAEALVLLGHAHMKAESPATAKEAWCKAKALGSDEGARLCK